MSNQQNNQQSNNYSSTVPNNQQLLSNILNTIYKLKLMINIQIDNQTSTQQQSLQSSQKQSLSQTNINIISKLLHIFKILRSVSSQSQMRQVQNQLIKCEQIIKIFQIKIINVIQQIMNNGKNLGILQQSGKNTINSVYQEFYILCSQFMNYSYQYSNKLCMLLSQQVKTFTNSNSNSNSNSNNNNNNGDCNQFTKQLQIPKSNKAVYNADYFLLKQLLQRVSHVKKMYEQQKQKWVNQKFNLQQIITLQKKQIKNLTNIKNQLNQDMYEIEQAIEQQDMQRIKNIIHNRQKNHQKQAKQKKSSVQNLVYSKKVENQVITKKQQIISENNLQIQSLKDENTVKLMKQVEELTKDNQKFLIQNTQLKIKLDKYIQQIQRATWIISVQNRQISLNQDKIKLFQKSMNNKNNQNIFNSDVSFNPNRGTQFSKIQMIQSPMSKISIGSQRSPQQNFHKIKLAESRLASNKIN